MRRFAVSVYVSPRSYISKNISTSGTKSAILDCLAAAHYYQAKDHTCRHNMNKLVLLVFSYGTKAAFGTRQRHTVSEHNTITKYCSQQRSHGGTCPQPQSGRNPSKKKWEWGGGTGSSLPNIVMNNNLLRLNSENSVSVCSCAYRRTRLRSPFHRPTLRKCVCQYGRERCKLKGQKLMISYRPIYRHRCGSCTQSRSVPLSFRSLLQAYC